MKKALCLLAAVLMCCASSRAGAEDSGRLIDMDTLTCRDFITTMSSDAASLGLLVLWLDGFGSARSGNHVINLHGIQSDMKDIVKYCAQNPDSKVLDLY